MHALMRHQASFGAEEFHLSAAAEATGELVGFTFELRGPIAGLIWPPFARGERADDLWRNTCFEAFLRFGGEAAYWEWNFSPSGRWACYRFEAYRAVGRSEPDLPAPRTQFHISANAVRLEAQIKQPQSENPLALGLSAVLETGERQISYWALSHPSDTPDFHHPAGFLLKI